MLKTKAQTSCVTAEEISDVLSIEFGISDKSVAITVATYHCQYGCGITRLQLMKLLLCPHTSSSSTKSVLPKLSETAGGQGPNHCCVDEEVLDGKGGSPGGTRTFTYETQSTLFNRCT